jgi:hypothetical protein
MGGRIYLKSIIAISPVPAATWEECVPLMVVAPD